MRFKGVQHALQLVGDVELVRVEHDDDEVRSLGEPLNHLAEVVVAPQSLLLSRQHLCATRLQHLYVHTYVVCSHWDPSRYKP